MTLQYILSKLLPSFNRNALLETDLHSNLNTYMSLTMEAMEEDLVLCKLPMTEDDGDNHTDNIAAIHHLLMSNVSHFTELHFNSSTTFHHAYSFLITMHPSQPTTSPSTASPVSISSSPGLGWFEGILLCLCVIGVSGNILNLLVLTRRRFCSSLNNLESSANYGLIALAISDLCFCLVVLPHVFLSGR